MKKRNVFLLVVFLILFVLVVIGGKAFVREMHQRQVEAERLREIERTVQNTKKEYAFFSKGDILEDCDDPIKSIFNEVNVEQEKDRNIDFEKFVSLLLDDVYAIKSNEKKLKGRIDEEIKKYEVDVLKTFESSRLLEAEIDDDLDLDTLVDLYENHEFVKNLDEEIAKREEYVDKLKTFKKELNYFFTNNKKYYVKNKEYVCTDDATLKKIGEFAKKYSLNIKAKKQVVVVNPNGVPILCYHGVLDNPWGIESLFVQVSSFEEQMRYLSENGYTPIFASEIANARNYKKPVVITFDDGYRDVYTNAFPILKKYNMKANVYMISDWIDGDVYMTSAMTLEMANSPLIEIGSHTATHRALATLSDEEIEKELSESKTSLENTIGKNVGVVAYPTGSFDSRVVEIAKKYYQYGLSTIDGKEEPAYLNRYSLRRRYVYRYYNLEQFKAVL